MELPTTRIHSDAQEKAQRTGRGSRRRPLRAALVSGLLLALLAAACGAPMLPAPSPTPTEEMVPTPEPEPTDTLAAPTLPPETTSPTVAVQTYTSKALGVQIPYPSGWLVSENDDALILGTSEEVLAGGTFSEGAGLVLRAEPLPNAEWEDVDELSQDRASVFESEHTELGPPEEITIDGQRASIVRWQGTLELSPRPLEGFVAVAIVDHWAYTFVAVSVAGEWPTYGPALQAMAEGAHFMPREVSQWPPDTWEPDDTLQDASELASNTSQAHDLHLPGDQDWVRFEATRGHVYIVETADLGEDVDTQIFLYDCAGRLLAQDDDSGALEEAWASRLVWTAEHTCSHYVMVHDVGDDDAGPGTSYNLRIWEEVRFVEDEYEPDDKPSLATLLEPGVAQAHNLHVAGDQDWSRLGVKAGYAYIIETSRLGADVDTVLQLLDEEGKELAFDDNGRQQDEPLASRLRWTAEADAVLYALVRDNGDDAEGPGTEYWLSVVETRP
jgi:hypothetical protein